MEQRKNPRLKNYDYSGKGAYFVTVCTDKRKHILSTVVGRGLAPAENVLTEYGKIVDNQLLDLEKRFSELKVDKYVIMPNHVHLILFLEKTAGASFAKRGRNGRFSRSEKPNRPTVSDIICAWKSLSARQCKQEGLKTKLWQTSFYDHIIRDEQDYFVRWKYIDENPAKWAEDEYF